MSEFFSSVCTQSHIFSAFFPVLTTGPMVEQGALVGRGVGSWCMAGLRSLTLLLSLPCLLQSSVHVTKVS